MKVISVTPTSKCDKIPRCRFCYLKGKTDAPFDDIRNKLKELVLRFLPETVTFAYNEGYPIANLQKLIHVAQPYSRISVTTRLGPSNGAAIIMKDIDYLTISIDYPEGAYHARMSLAPRLNILRRIYPALKIGINFLMEKPVIVKYIINFLERNYKAINQFHFLVPKNVPIEYDLDKETRKIRLLKAMIPDKIFIDECLKVHMTGEPCRRGREMLSLNSDTSITLCSFAPPEDKELDITKCPYLIRR